MHRFVNLRLNVIAVMLLLIPMVGLSQAQVPPPPDAGLTTPTPEIIKQVAPKYPKAARIAGIEGQVVVKLMVDKTGAVSECQISKTSGHAELDKAALEAVKQYRFKPAMQGDNAVATWVAVPVIFKLNGSESEEHKKVDVMPELINQIEPEYPDEAKTAGKEGVVVVKALISKKGKPVEIKIVRSSCDDCGFEESTLAAVKQYAYKPAIVDGRPIAVWVSFKVSFKLD